MSLQWEARRGQIHKEKIEWWLLGAVERARREPFDGESISVLQEEKRSGVWLHNSGNGINTTELYLKRNEMANFMSFMFYHNLKKNLKTKQNEKTKTN